MRGDGKIKVVTLGGAGGREGGGSRADPGGWVLDFLVCINTINMINTQSLYIFQQITQRFDLGLNLRSFRGQTRSFGRRVT